MSKEAVYIPGQKDFESDLEDFVRTQSAGFAIVRTLIRGRNVPWAYRVAKSPPSLPTAGAGIPSRERYTKVLMW